MSKPELSVIIPVYNYAEHLKKTIQSIIKQLGDNNVEIIVFDDCSIDDSFEVAKSFKRVRAFKNKVNSGPAKTRNNAIKRAGADIIAFIDSDVIVADNWINNILKYFKDKDLQVVMGGVKISKSTFLGDSISALGFPGGGSVGFDKIWKVDEHGYTQHITSCNFIARKKIFEKYGYFDESFPFAGGEDPELAYRWSGQGVKIRYISNILVYHKARKDMKSFIRWMIIRGKSSYLFQQKVDGVGKFISLRLWSTKNIIKKFIFTPNIILIIPLLFLGYFLQVCGYFLQLKNDKNK